MTNGYAVIIEYWNGTTYSVDYSDIVVYHNKAEAEKNAEEVRNNYGAEGIVTVTEVVIKS
jgi:hypothetical protein